MTLSHYTAQTSSDNVMAHDGAAFLQCAPIE
jgi:hypothetical protein